ncbi:MAG: GntR family transcriptional regulator [Oscillospiraceae bacterium]|nr:GntR family transcriptional regulator [Oscillospiraceae bacterium]
MLDPKTATPLYVQMIDILERQIVFGELEAGERLPSESELAKQFGVSIITVRNAVGELCKRGLLERKQGKGTFVRKTKITRDSRTLSSFTESCRNQGLVPGGRMLENNLVVLNAKLARSLGQTPGSQAVYMSRLRFANQEPVIIERNYFPIKYAFLLEEVFDDDSLFECLRNRAQAVVTRSDKEIELCHATQTEGELLRVPQNSPLILVKSTAYLPTGEPLYVGTQVMNGEHFKLQITQGTVL